MKNETLIKSFSDQISKERGSTMVEYALMIALVAASCVVSIRSVGSVSNTAFDTVYQRMANGGVEESIPPGPE